MSDKKVGITLKLFDGITAPLKKVQNNFKRMHASAMKNSSAYRGLNNASKIFINSQRMLISPMKRVVGLMGRQAKTALSLKKSLGGMGALAGAGMLALSAHGLNTAANFEKSMDKVFAVSGIAENSIEAKMLTGQAKELGASTRYSASEVSEGQQYLAMAGFKPEQIKEAMPGLLSLATAGDTDLATTSDISSNILSAFGMEASEMSRLGDVLTATFTRSNVDLKMLGETMKYAAPVAKELGVSLEETAAMSGALGNIGIQAGQAGTALRAIYSRMAAPPKMAADAMAEIGLKAKNASGNLRSMPDILTEIAEKTKDMGNADRMRIFKAIAGAEAGSGFAGLLADQGMAAFKELLAGYDDIDGITNDVAAKMADNLTGDKVALGSAIEGLQIEFFGAMIPDARKFTQLITKIVRGLTGWVKNNPKFAKFAAIFATIAGALIATAGAATFMAPIFAALLGPVGLLIATIAGGAAYIITNWDNLKGYFEPIFTNITDVFNNFIILIKAIWGGDWSGAKVALVNLKNSLVALANSIWVAVKAAFIVGLNTIDDIFGFNYGTTLANVKAIWQPVDDFLSGFGIGLANNFEPIADSFSSLWKSVNGVGKAFADLFSEVFGSDGNDGGGAKEFGRILGEVAGAGISLFGTALGVVAEAIKSIVEGLTWLVDAGKDIWAVFTGIDRFSKWEVSHNEAAKAINAHISALQGLTGAKEDAIFAIAKMTKAQRIEAAQQANIGLMKASDENVAILKQNEKIFKKLQGKRIGWHKNMAGGEELFVNIKNNNVSSQQLYDFIENNQGHKYALKKDGSYEKWFGDLISVADALKKNEEQVNSLNAAKDNLKAFDNLDKIEMTEELGKALKLNDVAPQIKPVTDTKAQVDPVADTMPQNLKQAKTVDITSKIEPIADITPQNLEQVKQLTADIDVNMQALNSTASTTQANINAATAVLQATDWSKQGVRLMETLATGVKQGQKTFVNAVAGAVGEADKYNSHSDAERGPFSDLTYSGRQIMNTLGKGIGEVGATPITRRMNSAFKEVENSYAPRYIGENSPQNLIVNSNRQSNQVSQPQQPSNNNITINVSVKANKNMSEEELANKVAEQVANSMNGALYDLEDL